MTTLPFIDGYIICLFVYPGHREVAAILQCPGEWLVVGNNDSPSPTNDDDFPETGDKEMAAVYLE